MNNKHNKNFIKCGFLNNFIISIISNYKFINSLELDYLVLYFLKKINCKSSTINYENYKFSTCISNENIICHGIPFIKKFKCFFIKIDISINYKKIHSDSCYTTYFFYKKKIFYFKKYFFNIINKIKKNKNIFINLKKNKNIFINENFCSHGIFKKLHNNIILFHCNKINKKVKNLDTFTIEPMFIFYNKNGYLYKKIFFSKKKNYSFQWEHCILILKNKIILTTIKKNELCFI